MQCYVLPRYDWTCGQADSMGLDDDSMMPTSGELSTSTPPAVHTKSSSAQLCKPHHNPCKNNAICRIVKPSVKTSNSSKLRVQCHCPLGFSGKLCEEDVDECALTSVGGDDQPVCASMATCINTHGSYICNCTLEPATLCYNTLSSKYSASVVDLKHLQKTHLPLSKLVVSMRPNHGPPVSVNKGKFRNRILT